MPKERSMCTSLKDNREKNKYYETVNKPEEILRNEYVTIREN